MIRKPKGITARLRAGKKRRADAVYAANRLTVIARDGGLCRWCQQPGTEVHHLQPRSLGVDHSTGNLLLICQKCHSMIHAKSLRVSGNADSMLVFEVLT